MAMENTIGEVMTAYVLVEDWKGNSDNRVVGVYLSKADAQAKGRILAKDACPGEVTETQYGGRDEWYAENPLGYWTVTKHEIG